MIVRELVKIYKLTYEKVDTTEKVGQELATRFGVRSLPLLMFLEYGLPVHGITGQHPRVEYEFKIKKFALKKSPNTTVATKHEHNQSSVSRRETG